MPTSDFGTTTIITINLKIVTTTINAINFMSRRKKCSHQEHSWQERREQCQVGEIEEPLEDNGYHASLHVQTNVEEKVFMTYCVRFYQCCSFAKNHMGGICAKRNTSLHVNTVPIPLTIISMAVMTTRSFYQYNHGDGLPIVGSKGNHLYRIN